MRLDCNWRPSSLPLMTPQIHNRGPILTPDATRLQLDLLCLATTRDTPLPSAAFLTTIRTVAKLSLHYLGLCLCLLATAWAGVGGSISGTVKDPSGAAIAKASVTLINSSTGVRQSATADSRGTYTFPVLPVGNYALQVSYPGFNPYRRTGIVLDTNSALLLDVVLAGRRAQRRGHSK